MERLIKKIDIITEAGANSYFVGENLNGGVVYQIKLYSLCFQGDPYDHYCGFDVMGQMLFSVNCLVPCSVEYLIDTLK